jgi:hypothetical protein
MNFRTTFGLFLIVLGLSSCVGNLDFVLPFQDGTWDVDKYIAVTEVNNDTIANLTYDNVGTILFEKDGTGTADISVPGNTLTDQEITWSFDKDEAVLTIDWQDGDDPWEFDVITSEMRYMQLRRTETKTIFGVPNTNIRELQLRKE